MKIRNKIFIFILSLLIPSLIVLIFVVSTGLERNMLTDIEGKLLNYKEVADIILTQELEDFSSDKLRDKSEGIAGELSKLFNLRVSIFSRKVMLADSRNLYDTITPEVEHALNGEIAYRRIRDRLAFAFPVGEIGAVRMLYPLDTVNAIISRTVTSITLVILLLIAAGAAAAGILSGKIAGPLVRLNRETERIKSGDYELEIEPASGDEVGELTSSFVEMSREIKEKIRQLEDMVAREKRLKRLQRDFLNNVTHEFKTPLTSIIGYADLIQNYQDDPALLSDAGKIIRKEGERLYQLVEKVLYLSRLEQYDFEPEMKVFQLDRLVSEAAAGIRIKAESRGIEIVEKTGYRGPIRGDFNLLYRMLLNLLDNAVKYSPGGSRVELITAAAAAPEVKAEKSGAGLSEVIESADLAITDAPGVRLTVRDYGPGISSETGEKIFQPFYREDKDRSRKVGGDGLGLAIVREIVDKHRGEVVIESPVESADSGQHEDQSGKNQSRGPARGGTAVTVLLPLGMDDTGNVVND